jgi:hypothetical protein
VSALFVRHCESTAQRANMPSTQDDLVESLRKLIRTEFQTLADEPVVDPPTKWDIFFVFLLAVDVSAIVVLLGDTVSNPFIEGIVRFVPIIGGAVVISVLEGLRDAMIRLVHGRRGWIARGLIGLGATAVVVIVYPYYVPLDIAPGTAIALDDQARFSPTGHSKSLFVPGFRQHTLGVWQLLDGATLADSDAYHFGPAELLRSIRRNLWDNEPLFVAEVRREVDVSHPDNQLRFAIRGDLPTFFLADARAQHLDVNRLPDGRDEVEFILAPGTTLDVVRLPMTDKGWEVRLFTGTCWTKPDSLMISRNAKDRPAISMVGKACE